MKKWKTGEKHPRKISGSAKGTELRQARRFAPAGYFDGTNAGLGSTGASILAFTRK
jgi:hypothetical protein